MFADHHDSVHLLRCRAGGTGRALFFRCALTLVAAGMMFLFSAACGDSGNGSTDTDAAVPDAAAADAQVPILNIERVSSIDLTGMLEGVYASQQYAVVAANEMGVHIVDFADAQTPQLVTTYDTVGHARDLTVVGDLVYVADHEGGFLILDITNPASPSEAGNFTGMSVVYGFDLVGNMAYLAGGARFEMVDVTNPSACVSLAGVDLSPMQSAHSAAVDGNYAYVGNDDDGVQVVDVTDASSMAVVHTVDTPGRAMRGSVSGDYLYITDYYSVQIIDVSDPLSASMVGEVDTSGRAADAKVDGHFLYVVDAVNGLDVYDITDPTNPVPAGSYREQDCERVYASGALVYLTTLTTLIRLSVVPN